LYSALIEQWGLLAEVYAGWTLSEIKDLSPRERLNWLEIARAKGRLVVKK
jgi:hypothetical protein